MSDVVLAAIIAAIVGVGTVILKYMLDNGSKYGSVIIILIIFVSIVCVLHFNHDNDPVSEGNGGDNGSAPETVSDTSVNDKDIEEDIGDDNPEESVSETSMISKQISLLQLEPYTFSPGSGLGLPFEEENNPKDIFGNQYHTALRAYMSMTDGEYYRIYRLNREYDVFSFTLAIPDSSRGSEYTGDLFIYTDNNQVKKITGIKSDTDSTHIEIPVRGVNDLKIEMYGDGNITLNGISVMMCDPTLTVEN